MSVRKSRQAEADIVGIYVSGIRDFGLQQADKYMTGLDSVMKRLSQFPRMARERLEITPPVRVYPYGAHLVIYTVNEDDDVYVLRVRHGHEDWMDDPV